MTEQLKLNDTEPETYEIPEHRMDKLRSKVKRYTRRAHKLGLRPFRLIESEPVCQPVHRDNDTSKPIIGYRMIVPCQLIGKAPVLAGWRFVAKIEHLGEAGNIISAAPDFYESSVVPAEMRDSKPTCDHCHTTRQRKETFVCQHDDDGHLVRVGRSCLKDFCGTKDAAAAVAIWALMSEVEKASDPDSDWDDCGSWAVYPDTDHYIACAFRAVKRLGWQASKGSYSGGPPTTKEEAAYAATPLSRHCHSESEKQAWEEAQPLDSDKVEASEAIAWAKSLDGSNDYQHNLKVAVSLPYADRKRYGLLASLVVAYRRHLDQKVERSKTEKLGANSKHFGIAGRRYLRKVTLKKSHPFETRDFEMMCIHTFEDSDSNLLKWFTSPGEIFKPTGPADDDEDIELELGDDCWLSFTVKRHGEYMGVEDTSIYRCRTAIGPEVYKWLADDGEIFKTKKEMKAA